MTRVVQVPLDDLSVRLPGWRTHVRARSVAPSTISSYLRAGEALYEFLIAKGMPTSVGSLTRDHLEASWQV